MPNPIRHPAASISRWKNKRVPAQGRDDMLRSRKKPDIPFVDPPSVKRAKREDEAAGKQGSLL
jgi:hypothetical protein